MRALIQRVSRASVRIEEKEKREVQRGLCVFLGLHAGDKDSDREWLLEKILNLRVFPASWGPEASKGADKSQFDLSVQEIKGDILLVSQFTLYANARKGRRPDFSGAAPPEQARALYASFVAELKRRHPATRTGEFGAGMQVDCRNEGPVTLWLDSQGRG